MKVKLNYGSGNVEFVIPDNNVASILRSRDLPPLGNVDEAVVKAIREPVGAPPLKDVADKNARIALLVSDITRPCPSYRLLPSLVAELNRYGVSDDHITIFFATGMRRGHTLGERQKLVGAALFKRIKTVDHDSHDRANLQYLGKTERGTEVTLNKQVLQNDLVIGIANIEIHYFAGYSGGGKSLLPGVAAFETIQQNHSLMLLPGSEPGKADGNPVREDIEEAGQIARFGFIVNAVLNKGKEIVKTVAGHYVEAHRSVVAVNDYMYKTPMEEKADIVVASAGGSPKDTTLYQAQKGLDNASYAVKQGGTIVFIAECAGGMGNKLFAQWLLEANRPEDVVERLGKGFVLGGHKAYAIAKLAQNVDISLISRLPEDVVKQSFMTPVATMEGALTRAFAIHGKDATVALLPHADSTLPFIR